MVSSPSSPSQDAGRLDVDRRQDGGGINNNNNNNKNNNRRNNKAINRKISLFGNQSVCPKPSSKAQWIIISTLIGGFMFMLMNNHTSDQVLLHRQASTVDNTTLTGIKKSNVAVRRSIDQKDYVINLDTVNNNNIIMKYDDEMEENESEDTVVEDYQKKTRISTKEISSTTTKKPIRQISILGERNSGTRWTFEHLSNCFNHTLIVRRRLTRYKHWFQHDDPSQYAHNTLVLGQYRNPYDWLKAMEHVPHHSPAHLRSALRTPPATTTTTTAITNYNNTLFDLYKDSNTDWKLFLTKPWTTARIGLDLQMSEDAICQDNFAYKDVVSCSIEPLPKSSYGHKLRYSEHQPFYEMRNDGSGLPYNNIMEMRTDKIRNFLSVKSYEGVADVWTILYEDLVKDGTKEMIDKIATITGVEARCKPKEPQNRITKSSRIITKEYASFIEQHLNWTVEAMIGYSPRN